MLEVLGLVHFNNFLRLRQTMNSRKRGNDESASKLMWKEKPPGPEQCELERMFRSNEIDARASPDSVKQRNEIFMGIHGIIW